MNIWMIPGCFVLVLFLLSLVRVGGGLEYTETGVTVQIHFGFLRLTVFPFPKKKKRAKPQKTKKSPKVKKEKKKKQVPETTQTKQGGAFRLFKAFLPLVAESAGRLKHKIRVDKLYLDFTSGGIDPVAAAMGFGGANAALSMILPLLEHNFNMKQHRVRTAVDFNLKAPILYLNAAFSLTIGQAVVLTVTLFFKFMKVFSAYKAENETHQKEKEAI